MTHAKWHPHDHPDYDAVLAPRSSAELAEILTGEPEAVEAFLRDTRPSHRRLYASLTPPEHPEYAGTYRGEPGTSLEGRRAGASLVTRDGERGFIEPDKVRHHVDKSLGLVIDSLVAPPATDGPAQLFQRAAKVFYVFGLIHPYLDGNGHIQRLVFAAAVARHRSLTLLPSWTIHPRPYDIEMAEAFEQGHAALATVTALLSQHVSY